jgi:hypothetical protein
MEKKSPTLVWFFPVLIAALVVWGGLLALGTYLGPEFWAEPTEDGAPALVPPFDVRKPLIVMGVLAVFLGVWGLALRSRSQRLKRRAADAIEEQRATTSNPK